MLANVPIWEEEHGMEFLVDDVRIVDIIITDRETKEAEKEAKRVSSETLQTRQEHNIEMCASIASQIWL